MSSAHHRTPGLAVTRWRSSTYSGGNNECVEVADNLTGPVPVRDSKRPTGPVIGFGRDAWQVFVDHLR